MAFAQLDFYSSVLQQSTRMNVILPESYISYENPRGHSIERNYPVLYLLHGYNGDETVWMRWTALERYCKQLPLCVVMPRGEHSLYLDGTTYQYYTYLTEELPAKVQHFFPVSTKREDTFIAGLSMGGYGAFRAALGRPDLYSYAASLSGAVALDESIENGTLTGYIADPLGDLNTFKGSDNDLKQLLSKRCAEGAELPELYMTCGTEDFLLESNRHYRDHIRSNGLEVTYEEHPGDHHWDYWHEHIQDVLDWLPLDKY